MPLSLLLTSSLSNSKCRHLKEAINKVGPKGKVIHIAHSQGALITFLAAKRLTKEELSQIEVICFGGAEVLRYSETFPFARCINYYSVNDPLLFVNPSAAKALRSGFMGVGGGVTTQSSQLAEMVNPNAEPELVFLTPKVGDPIEDHGLFAPTYLDALKWEGRRYQNLYMTPWDPYVQTFVTRSKSLTSSTQKALAASLEIVKERVILPVLLFVLSVNSWLKEKVLVPTVIFLLMIWEKIMEWVRILRGEDVYEPIAATE